MDSLPCPLHPEIQYSVAPEDGGPMRFFHARVPGTMAYAKVLEFAKINAFCWIPWGEGRAGKFRNTGWGRGSTPKFPCTEG